MPLVARWGSSFLRTITFSIIHRFLSLKVLLLIYCFSKSTAYNTFQFEKLFWIWWKVLDTIILWQDVGPCCEQTHAAFEVGLCLDQGQGVYSGWSDVVGSSQLRLCHTCILDGMGSSRACNRFSSWYLVTYVLLLYVDPRFGNPVLKDSWFVSLIKSFSLILPIHMYLQYLTLWHYFRFISHIFMSQIAFYFFKVHLFSATS